MKNFKVFGLKSDLEKPDASDVGKDIKVMALNRKNKEVLMTEGKIVRNDRNEICFKLSNGYTKTAGYKGGKFIIGWNYAKDKQAKA